MNKMASLLASRAPRFTQEEWDLRCELAAAYRLAALNGWVDGVATHISARIPGEETFLINPFGLLFPEVTASNLVKVDIEGNIVQETEHSINPAGFIIHSAVHEARPDVGCVMHLHTDEGVAVSCLEDGLMPISQSAMLICDEVAYHDYEGVSTDLDERRRLGEHLGEQNFLMLRNHGLLTAGVTVGLAFCRMAALQKACQVQVMALSMGRPIGAVTPESRQRSAEVGKRTTYTITWNALRRGLDRVTTDYMA
jgi:ribulose-5-phosphate 4-epimerase/fuculose-1-phosphate aldolase